jgi:hypothetical protein
MEKNNMNKILKVIVAAPAILFLIIGVRWLVAPAGVAAEFGMPFLDGLGRSTQIGDFAAFFIGIGTMILLGLVTQRNTWFLAPALVLSLTAVFRLVAWLAHDASFAAEQIAVEVLVSALLLFAASRTNGATGQT